MRDLRFRVSCRHPQADSMFNISLPRGPSRVDVGVTVVASMVLHMVPSKEPMSMTFLGNIFCSSYKDSLTLPSGPVWSPHMEPTLGFLTKGFGGSGLRS